MAENAPVRTQESKSRRCGMLRSFSNNSIDSLDRHGGTGSPGEIVIWFPCIKDSIELRRSANFENKGPTLATPDGVWIYKNTEPLKIPIHFELHYNDELCSEGSYSLLSISAKLHALTLPTDSLDSSRLVQQSDKDKNVTTSLEQINLTGMSVNNISAFGSALSTSLDNQVLAWPPACELYLIDSGISDEDTNFAVHCRGFVTEVVADLKGPWLKSATGSNLPSIGAFSFTFINNPAYGNGIGPKITDYPYPQSFGPDVYAGLYNSNSFPNVKNYSGVKKN